MKAMECLRENEVLENVSCGRWPDECSDELRSHVASCCICADVLEVAVALHADREAAQAGAQIPSADLVWWRSELRSRQEAVRIASRPITMVQAFGAAAGVGAALAIIRITWPWLKSFFVLPDLSLLSFTQLSVVAVCAVAVLVIAPLAMYLVLSDE